MVVNALKLDQAVLRKRLASIRDRFEDDIAWTYTTRLVAYVTGPHRPHPEFTTLNGLMKAIGRPESYNAARFRHRESERPFFFLILQALGLMLDEVDLGVVPTEITAEALRTTAGWIGPDGTGGADRQLDELQFEFLLASMSYPGASSDSILEELQRRGIGSGTRPDIAALMANNETWSDSFGFLCLMLKEFDYAWEF